MIRIGFTGTQNGMTVEQSIIFCQLLKELNPTNGRFRHGDCVGADAEAHDFAKLSEYFVTIHPPDDPKKRAWCVGDEMWPEKPYLVRNHDIVDNSDRMIAAPKLFYEELRSGTWHTIRYTKRTGKRLYIIWPNGTMDISTGA